MSASRRRLQRAALVFIGALLLVVGVRQLGGVHFVRAGSGSSAASAKPSVPGPDRDVIRGTSASDVLFAQSFAVREGDQLLVDLGAEQVEVLPARGNEAIVTVRGEGRNARDVFEGRRFTASHSDGTLEIRTNPPRGIRMNGRNARLSVTIEVPARFDASINVGSGAVHIERLSGNLKVDTGSGAISIGTARGDRISLDTGSGGIQADVLQGEVTASTGSGTIRVGKVTGSFDGDTGSGSINVAEADVDRLYGDTGSGSVTARLTRSAEVSIDTGSGRVALTLPRASGADIDISGRPIHIDGTFRFDGDKQRDRARGTIGGGGPTIEIDTNSGGISLIAL